VYPDHARSLENISKRGYMQPGYIYLAQKIPYPVTLKPAAET
jgi:hypothetical protein